MADGLLPHDVGVAALADLAIALRQGLSMMARDGAERAALQEVVDAALHAWRAK